MFVLEPEVCGEEFVGTGLGLLQANLWCCVSLVLIEVLLHIAVQEGLRELWFPSIICSRRVMLYLEPKN
jgi:hypothetical protein